MIESYERDGRVYYVTPDGVGSFDNDETLAAINQKMIRIITEGNFEDDDQLTHPLLDGIPKDLTMIAITLLNVARELARQLLILLEADDERRVPARKVLVDYYRDQEVPDE